jgi:hypothetical protein
MAAPRRVYQTAVDQRDSTKSVAHLFKLSVGQKVNVTPQLKVVH